MKKFLAIVLTLAMLLSMVAVSATAATREAYKDDDVENHYWYFQQGNSWHPVKFSNPSKTVEMDIKLDGDSSALGCYGLSNAPSIGATYVGLKDNSISVPYTFAADTWYNVKWVSANGSTEIFVNGESVGTVGAELTYYDNNQFYWAPVLVSMDNVKNGGQTFNFEGDNSAWNTESGQGMLQTEVFEGATHNELVATGENHYWYFQQGNSWHPVKFSNPSKTAELDIKLDGAGSSLGNYNLSNAPYVDANSVGLKDGNGNVAYSFAAETWYNVKWVSADGSTEIFVNGASVGTVSGELSYYDGNQFYWAPVLLAMDNVKVGGQTFDFEGDYSAWNTESGQGMLQVEEYEALRYELGTYYWHFQKGNSWHPVKFSNPTNEIEMAICLDDASSSLGCYGLSNAPSIGASYVGLKDSSISVPYTFTPGTWYDVKWVSADGKTAIYVDGALVGTVNATLTYYDNNQFYWAPVLLSMDNVKMGGQTFDFEGDNSAWNSESGQGERLEYPAPKADTIFDHISIDEPAGEGLLLSNSYNAASTYYDIDTAAGSGKDLIVDFNLKLYPQANERIADQQNGSWYEFWLDSACHNRVVIGTEAIGVQRSGSNDFTAFAFGADTWHRVTVEVLGSYNVLNIYIDGELVYEGTCGEVHWLDGRYLIGNTVAASAILDNYTIYAAKTYDVLKSGFGNGVERNDNERKIDDVNAPCNAAYGWHVPGTTVIETVETCYSVGNDVTTCAVCGATINHEVPMYAHKWQSYNINQKTEDGLVYIGCRNANGCTERRYTTLPKNYEGTLYQYYDMSDDMVLKANTGWTSSVWTIADGCANFTTDNNYNQFDLNMNIPANNWSWFMDITFNGTFDTKDTTQSGYAHQVYFWCGGNNNIAIQAGYNFDTNEFFIQPNDGGSFQAQKAAYALEEGKLYNFGITYEYDEDEYTGAIKLWLDGEVVCQYTDEEDEEIIFVIPYGDSTHHFNIFRDFGVYVSIDNMAYASADYKIVKILGDVDGDGELTAADVVAYRRYFSAQADALDLSTIKEADVNGDGVVNAKDLLAVRTTLAA